MSDFVRGLLQTALRRLDPSVTVVDVLLHVAHVVEVEPPFRFLGRWRGLVLCLQSFTVHFRARSEVLLRVGEEVVRAGPSEVRAADFGIRDRELGIATLGAGTEELIRCKESRG